MRFIRGESSFCIVRFGMATSFVKVVNRPSVGTPCPASPHPRPPSGTEAETQRFLGGGKTNRLFCPSGEIVIASLGELGKASIAPITKVEAGWYRVGFYCNDENEYEHYFLEDYSQYPATGSPDWIFYLQRERA